MKPSPADFHEAKEVLERFFDAMCAWENKYYTAVLHMTDADEMQRRLDEKMAAAAEELKGLFETYCLPGMACSQRLKGPSFSHPPDYDRGRGMFYDGEAHKGGLVFIFQQLTGTRDRMRFTMKKSDGRWRIFKAERFDQSADDWRPAAF